MVLFKRLFEGLNVGQAQKQLKLLKLVLPSDWRNQIVSGLCLVHANV